MPTPIQDMSSWGALGSPSTRPANPQDAPSTMTAMELWPPKAADVGKRVAETHWEMSVVCEPADAMKLQFDLQHRPHATVHDLSGRTSRRLLSGLAAAMQTQTQTLSVLRQGFGTKLATMSFVELPTKDATTNAKHALRIYSTAVEDAEARAARRLADVLMSHALLSVVMIPADTTAEAINAGILSIREAMTQESFVCRMVLLMPLGPMPTGLESKVHRFAQGRSVDVRVSPPIVRPLDAWNHLRSAWNLVTRIAAEQGESAMMVLPDPTSSGERAPMAIRTAVSARTAPAGAAQATVDALRKHLMAANEAEQRQKAKAAAELSAQQMAQQAAQQVAQPTAAQRAASTSHNKAAQATDLPPLMIDVPALTTPSPARVAPAAGAAKAAASAPVLAPLPSIAEAQHTRQPDLDVPINAPPVPNSSGELGDYVAQCRDIKGLKAVWVIDIAQRQLIVGHGVRPDGPHAADGTRLLNALKAAAMAFQMPGRVPELVMSLERHHLVVMPLTGYDKYAALALFDKVSINGTVAQLKMQRLAQSLTGALAPA